MKVWVVIPAYNEGNALEMILRELRRKNLSILVVDDGSSDNTFEVAKGAADIVIRNEKNLGKGMSLNLAFRRLLKESEFDYVITMDGDGQHSHLDIDNFLKEAKKGEYFVLGNRMDKPYGMPKIRIITNKLMSWLISKMINQKIPDTQCGFRLIKKDILNKIKTKTNKFEMESEIIIKAAKKKFSIKSIPIRNIYFRRAESKINPFIDSLRFLRFIFFHSNSD